MLTQPSLSLYKSLSLISISPYFPLPLQKREVVVKVSCEVKTFSGLKTEPPDWPKSGFSPVFHHGACTLVKTNFWGLENMFFNALSRKIGSRKISSDLGPRLSYGWRWASGSIWALFHTLYSRNEVWKIPFLEIVPRFGCFYIDKYHFCRSTQPFHMNSVI